jgi:hypothetical protein
MAKKNTSNVEEYFFRIGAYSRERMPMRFLAAYMEDLAILLGEEHNVHFDRLKDGSTVLVSRIEHEAAPKVRDRVHRVRLKEGPPEAMQALARIDERLRKDNADGDITTSSDNRKILVFPGANKKLDPVFGPFTQVGTLDGIPIRIGGEKEWVPVHLEGHQDEVFICHAKRSVAKQIAAYLFTSVIRVEGKGRWIRNANGIWEMIYFSVADFSILKDAKLQDDFKRLRSIPGKWKESEDPIGDLEIIRHDIDIQ